MPKLTAAVPSNRFQQFKPWLAYSILLLLILSNGMLVVFQIFNYRHDYRQKNQLLAVRDDLNAERGRLLIEQQTFGATAQIGTRAVTGLRMYSPPMSQTVVIQLPTATAASEP